VISVSATGLATDWRLRLHPFIFVTLILVVATLFLLELMSGSVSIPLRDALAMLGKNQVRQDAWLDIIVELRLPRAITAVFCGAALGVAGLLLQTLFRNPLAGPWVLGITAGAQFGVALVVAAGAALAETFLSKMAFLGELGLVLGAMLGASAIALVIAGLARRVSTITLLVVGLMLGYLAEGLVSVVLHFTTEVQARVFASWNDGSFGGVQWRDFPLLLPLLALGFAGSIAMIKQLNALILGEEYAATLGLAAKRARYLVLACSVVLAAPVTAYCGPVLFLGIIAPHLARGLFNTSDHRALMPASLLIGASLALAADLVVHLPWERHFLHLNAVNAVIGAPLVILIVLRNRQMRSLVL